MGFLHIWNIITGILCLIAAIPLFITIIFYYRQYRQMQFTFQTHLLHTLISVNLYILIEASLHFHYVIFSFDIPNWVYCLPMLSLIPAMFSFTFLMDAVGADKINSS